MQKLFYALRIAAVAGLWLSSAACYAADIQRGRVLHDEECLVCHDNNVYTRENRSILTLEQLRVRVNLCQLDVGAEWSTEQLDDVVDFLNDHFYKFTETIPSTH